ncbi:helix-turn-helix domain-containing protein [Qiania dongpingensis]|uniref:Helix-turn-helix transcriptional regulator n=1 Tax=Qiania dongpingensis TaxID=2763669 RepID=A0A7G9G2S7_9FIRM|nr:helix-turn-helix transcriptional regulator [Qiania dongpingensis]QNM05109.1 helix-turn-helix transcriptional regulator [Qiania dongpingensis]
MGQQKQNAGEQIQRLRSLWGLSQSQLAEAIGTSADYISDIEGERKPLSLRSAWKFCTYFGVGLDELYFGREWKEAPDSVAEPESPYHTDHPVSSKDSLWEILETCTEEECEICEKILRQTLDVLRQSSNAPIVSKSDEYPDDDSRYKE